MQCNPLSHIYPVTHVIAAYNCRPKIPQDLLALGHKSYISEGYVTSPLLLDPQSGLCLHY